MDSSTKKLTLDVVGMGELLIDFSPNGKGAMQNPSFEMNPGGAPPNCLSALTALGGTGGIIAMVGEDMFGDFLIHSLQKASICTDGVRRTNKCPTTLAFVSIDDNGERSFSFIRNPGADCMLSEADVNLSLIDSCKIFHYGIIPLTDEPGRSSQYYAMDYAKRARKLMSFDPNYRNHIWKNDAKSATMHMNRCLEYCDIVKLSENEMEMVTGIPEHDYARGAKAIFDTGKTAVFITLGADGAYFITKDECGHVPGYKLRAVDTTGCGDSFTGAIHYMLCHHPDNPMKDTVQFACAVGALVATKYGGIPAMPSLPQVHEFMKSV